jgi:2-polyprenyl-3-methyl-5-hydroxy-6-metoxy-1,4-benzoquinol methylase
MFEQVTGLDTSAGMVDQFNKKAAHRKVAEKVHAIKLELSKPGQLKETYDVIFSNLAFHHVEDISKMCKILGSALRPGGIMIAVDFLKSDYSVLFHPPGTLYDSTE